MSSSFLKIVFLVDSHKLKHQPQHKFPMFPDKCADEILFSLCLAENDCEKAVRKGASLFYLKEVFYLRDIKHWVGWKANEQLKSACFRYLERVSRSCNTTDTTQSLEECRQVCGE